MIAFRSPRRAFPASKAGLDGERTVSSLFPATAFLFITLVSANSLSADGFSAGAARRDITPPTNFINWVTKKPYTGLLDPLYVRALVMSDGTETVALLTWDLVDTRENFVASLRSAIETAVGIPSSNILINASHSHSAPWTPTKGDLLLTQEKRTLSPVEEGSDYEAWTKKLLKECVDATREAETSRRSATMSIGRARADEVLFNRRPRRPDGSVETVFEPSDPFSLPNGLRFGPLAPTLTVLALRGTNGLSIATLVHLPCHAVCVYPYDQRLSADWPGMLADQLEGALGGEVLFLQGCAGETVPARRGIKAAQAMGDLLAYRARSAWTNGFGITPTRLASAKTQVLLPLTDSAKQDLRVNELKSEVQVLWLGEVALVALPGEPLIGLANAIHQESPFPHTIVAGYSNGGGVQYVGLPGEKALGGYEMGPAGAGDDSCGKILVKAAIDLLSTRTVQELRTVR